MNESTRLRCTQIMAVVPRGNCSFSEKAFYSQSSLPFPYSALIVYTGRAGTPVRMSGGKLQSQVRIPSAMISHACMTTIMRRFPVGNGYMVMLKGAPSYYDLVKYLIPFIAVVCLCFSVLLVGFILRLFREHRRLSRRRLSRSSLRKIPTRKFRKGEEPETCPICLDDFVNGEKLRLLPCRHVYHCKCVDPWLTKSRKQCPVCKRKVVKGTGHSSDSDVEPGTTLGTERERDPLLLNRASVSSVERNEESVQAQSAPNYQSMDEENPTFLSPLQSPNPQPIAATTPTTATLYSSDGDLSIPSDRTPPSVVVRQSSSGAYNRGFLSDDGSNSGKESEVGRSIDVAVTGDDDARRRQPKKKGRRARRTAVNTDARVTKSHDSRHDGHAGAGTVA